VCVQVNDFYFYLVGGTKRAVKGSSSVYIIPSLYSRTYDELLHQVRIGDLAKLETSHPERVCVCVCSVRYKLHTPGTRERLPWKDEGQICEARRRGEQEGVERPEHTYRA
jgi:hypothetical protein